MAVVRVYNFINILNILKINKKIFCDNVHCICTC